MQRALSAATSLCALVLLVGANLQAQTASQAPPTPQERIKRTWNGAHQKVLTMAEDFPEDKHAFKATPETRSFGEVVLHVAQVAQAVAEISKGREGGLPKILKELEPEYKTFTSKADAVAKLKKAMEESKPAAEAEDNARLVGLIEHAGEQYGQLVVYYRLNGLVPPASRGQ